MRSCKVCGVTDPPRGFYGPYDKTCRACRDKRRKEQWAERYRDDEDFRTESRKRRTDHYRQIHADRYEELFEKQNGGCAICGITAVPLVMDHDHTCCPVARRHSCGECIRGLLCLHCNSVLGFARDEPAILESAIAYLAATSSPM